MRVLLLAQFFPPDIGGEERHVFNLANALAGRGHEVSVATQQMDGVPREEILPSGVRVHRFATAAMHLPGVYSTDRAHHPPVPDPLGVRELARIVRDEQPHIVHAHNWIVNSAVALRRSSSAGHRFGLVLTLHDYSHVCATKRLMRRGAVCRGPAVSRCLPCATAHYGPAVGPVTAAAVAAMRPWKDWAVDRVVSVSSAVAAANSVSQRANSVVIPNFIPDDVVATHAVDTSGGITAAVGSGLGPDGFLLFVGDLSREKGLHVLLHAYEALGRERPPLLLVGRRTSDTPHRLPPGAQIEVEWSHERVLAAFRRCIVAVLPSVWSDPCPTTVLEAMASGRPIVTTKTGGIVDMVVNGVSGLLVSPGSGRELAEAMARMLRDADLRSRLAAGAQDHVKPFTASAVVGRLEAVYEQVAEEL